MITPEYLEQAADQIEKIYTDFQEWAIRDIVNRLLETDFEVSGTTQWRAEKVQQAGLVYNDLTARIAKETGKSKTEIKRLFRDAGVEVYNYGDEVYQGLGIQPLSVRQSPAMLNVLMAGMKKTEKTMKNLTGTTASMAQSQFISACDGAWMAVSSGAVSYNEAVINAVGQVGSSGMWIRYPETGHRDRLDVATRRCVLSGLGRTVGTLNEMACDELDCDLVEVTAHWNARPSHAEWQGLVYSRSGKNKNYPDFSVCGYGTGAGLLGWNCYHDFHPFFEGISERLYTEKQLAEMKNAAVNYNGKEIGGYEATQVQRGIERKIRESKRKLIAYDEGIKNSSGTLRDDFRLRYSVESKQLSELNKRLDDFCSQTGFVKQYDRSRVQGFGRSQAQKAVQAGKKSLTGGGKSGMIKTGGDLMLRKSKGNDYIEPMPKKQLLRIEKEFKKRGGIILRNKETDDYLINRNAEGITINSNTILLRQNAGRASVFEELIHSTQYKNGKNDGSYLSRLQCEIEAQEKLLKYKTSYRLTENEIRQTKDALESYKNELSEYIKNVGV